MDSPHRTQKTKGFTLIELLIVAGIVAVIAAILFPVFAGVRERGRRTVCQSNLKQLALAMQQYVQDNDGVYPPPPKWEYAAYSYLKNVDTFRCPDHLVDITTSPLNFEGAAFPADYGWDTPRLYVWQSNFWGVMQESVLVNPSTTVLNTDRAFVSTDGVYRYCRLVQHTSCGRSFTGGTVHTDAANYSYVDGHVKWQTPEEAGEIDCVNGPPPVGFTNL